MVQEVYIDEFLDLDVRRGDILDDRGEEGECFLRAILHLRYDVYGQRLPQAVEDITLSPAAQELLDESPIEGLRRPPKASGRRRGIERELASCPKIRFLKLSC